MNPTKSLDEIFGKTSNPTTGGSTLNPAKKAALDKIFSSNPTPPSKTEAPIVTAGKSVYNAFKDVGNKTGEVYKGIGEGIVNSYNKAEESLNDKTKTPAQQLGGALEGSLGMASNASSALWAPIAGAVKSASDAVSNNKEIQGLASSEIGSKVLDAINGLTKPLSDLAKQHPEATQNISDTANILLNLMGLKTAPNLDIGQGIKGGVENIKAGATSLENALPEPSEAGGMIKSGVQNLYDALTSKSPEQLDSYVASKFDKGVRPSVAGKGTSAQLGKYQDKALQAVKTIADNKPNLNLVDEYGEPTGKLPQNLKQFSDAIDQTKKQIFAKYDALQKQAGDQGASVDLNPAVSELRTIQENPTVQDLHPELSKYAENRADALEKRGSYTTEAAQDAITNLNNSLEAFYKNPSYETASKASVDAMIANKLREGLDGVIEKTTGGKYQDLKDQYGSLKTIEKDVVHRSIVDARKNMKGLIDFSDIATGAEVIKGLATMNPTTIVTGLGGKAIAAYYKYLNNPNTAIKQLFNALEKGGLSEPTPLSPELNKVKPSPNNNLTPEEVNNAKVESQFGIKGQAEDPLLSEARKYKSVEEFVKAQTGGKFGNIKKIDINAPKEEAYISDFADKFQTQKSQASGLTYSTLDKMGSLNTALKQKGFKGVSTSADFKGIYSLDKVIDNPALFGKYPDLRKVNVIFADFHTPTQKGVHIGNDIFLNSKLYAKDPIAIESTLVHEIEHGIQDLTGVTSQYGTTFERGSNLNAKQYANDVREVGARTKQQEYLDFAKTKSQLTDIFNKAHGK